MKKIIVPVVLTAAATSALTFWGANSLSKNNSIFSTDHNTPVHYVNNTGNIATQPVDFSAAAEEAVKSVVHIKTLKKGETVMARDPFADMFGGFFGFEGGRMREYKTPDQQGSGSGVIISSDGYIVTNNHVVAGADKVQVTFNDRNTEIAEVVGTDPSTDLAVLKIKASNLKYMELGNSDDVKLGQWVLAVGYPLNLDATVTAGIVSAKGRALGINMRQSSSAVESYIQTDAAVNPGNSGGPLVNTQGRLIGINAAIASPTGSYAGYSYSIPSNIVEKVANDIIKHGSVQRGYLGVSLADLDDEQAEKLGLDKDEFRKSKGVYVREVMKGSGADAAGIKSGDYITAINGTEVKNVPQLMGLVARFHPGDKITVDYMRNGNVKHAQVELKKNFGDDVIADGQTSMKLGGATLRNLTKAEQEKYNIKDGGVLVEKVADGAFRNAGIAEGYIIASANDKRVTNIAKLNEVVKSSKSSIQVGGIYGGKNGMYYYVINGLNNNDVK